MKISIVFPIFNEEDNIEPLYRRVRGILASLTSEYELIFVDDGSFDQSLARIEKLSREDPNVKALSFSRNFGHQMALTAGMDRASGDAVILMDADLQHPPELLERMMKEWRDGNEIVFAVRTSTNSSSWIKRSFGSAFYRLFRWLTAIDLPMNAADFRRLDRKVIQAFQGIRERSRFLRGLTCWVGFRTCQITYVAPARQTGQTKYSWNRMCGLALDGIISFTVRPLYVSIYLGFLLALAGFLYGVYAVYALYFTNRNVPGWTSLFTLIAIIGGIQLIVLGMIGSYIGKTYEEVKGRPLYLIRREIGFAGAQ